MNRELKFRAWNILTEKMYYTGFAVQANGHIMLDGSLIRGDNLAAGWKVYKNEEELIPQQFTGFKDKNGKEIYEGDILDFYSGRRKVIWHNGMFLAPHIELDIKDFKIMYREELPFLDDEDYEITGNVFENPELIK